MDEEQRLQKKGDTRNELIAHILNVVGHRKKQDQL
jgi:hypothetical protein